MTSLVQFNQLQIGDLDFTNNMEAVIFKLSRSKTNHSSLPTVIKIPAEFGTVLCTVKTLESFLKVMPNLPGPLFCHIDGKAVIRNQFSWCLSKCIFEASLRNSCYKTHSFKIGRATVLSALEMPVASIKAMSCWLNSAFKLYIRQVLL